MRCNGRYPPVTVGFPARTRARLEGGDFKLGLPQWPATPALSRAQRVGPLSNGPLRPASSRARGRALERASLAGPRTRAAARRAVHQRRHLAWPTGALDWMHGYMGLHEATRGLRGAFL